MYIISNCTQWKMHFRLIQWPVHQSHTGILNLRLDEDSFRIQNFRVIMEVLQKGIGFTSSPTFSFPKVGIHCLCHPKMQTLVIQAIVNIKISWFPEEAYHQNFPVSCQGLMCLKKCPSGFTYKPTESFGLLEVYNYHKNRNYQVNHDFPLLGKHQQAGTFKG